VNGNIKLWLAVLGIVTGIITGGLGSTMLNKSQYEELEENDKIMEERFETFMANEMQEKVREEHRLTKIEEAILATNKLLGEIKVELQRGRQN